MGILTGDMRRVIGEQQLGFIATVCPDGTPNLRHIVPMKVAYAAPLISLAYDSGQNAAQVSARWRRYWEDLWNRDARPESK